MYVRPRIGGAMYEHYSTKSKEVWVFDKDYGYFLSDCHFVGNKIEGKRPTTMFRIPIIGGWVHKVDIVHVTFDRKDIYEDKEDVFREQIFN